jgi:hypothetical protein
MHWILRVGTALLLVGHGGYGVWMHKKVWLTYFSQLGLDAQTVSDLHLFYVVGWFEIALGFAVLVKPLRPLLIAVCAYKVGTELLRPAAGEPWWEFIERSGSYLCPIALVMVDTWLRHNPEAGPSSSASIQATNGDQPTSAPAAAKSIDVREVFEQGELVSSNAAGPR